MKYSKFGHKFTQANGITQLMEDLGKAKNSDNPDIVMLGGGNPALIPEANDRFVNELKSIIASSKVDQMIGLYDGPQGNDAFRVALANELNDEYNWGLNAENVGLSNGSQANFFSLFNLFAGDMPDGSKKKILFPLAPEYVGYADQGLSDDMFVSIKPDIEIIKTDTGSNQFKYIIDIDALKALLATDKDIGALCVSRPTNPTGNVITDDELQQLDALAKLYDIPLIIDNAYGHPFPGCIYTDVRLMWNSNIILCMSLSKLGLPGLRTGIVIANQDIIQALGRINGSMILAPNSVGPTIMTRMLKEKQLLSLCREIIEPYYRDKANTAVNVFDDIFGDNFDELPVYVHKLEGAFFMWLWFKDLKMGSEALYERLKAEDVYVIPGHNFFININDDWAHKHQCIRINYAKDETTLRKGLEAIKRIISEG